MKTKEYREKIAQAFVKSLSENPKGWKQEWAAPSNRPQNAVTGRPYRGINLIWLSFAAYAKGYKDPRWCTFNQAKKKEWKINRGEKGTHVEYWMPFDKTEKKSISWEEYNKLVSTKSDRLDDIRLVSKYFTVFNVEQMENVPEIMLPEGNDINPAEIIEKISKGMGVEIINDGGNSAFYRIREDKIHLPMPQYFDDDYSYNATALHELSHATGHPSRLNRITDGGLDRDYYAYEELVAEISSCFMGENLPIAMSEEHFENHKAYIRSWIEGIKEKPEVLMKAIGDAQKAADYLEMKAGLISEKEFKLQTEDSFETDKSRVIGYSDEADELAVEMETFEATVSSQKGYVKDFISEFINNYDFDHPKKVLASQVPSLMLAEKYELGGMYETDEECRAFIENDKAAAEHTMYNIKDFCPVFEDVVTPEKDPKMFSLFMMERELAKMTEDSKTLMKNYDKEIYFDRKIANEICEANNIKMPEDVKISKMRVPGIELDM